MDTIGGLVAHPCSSTIPVVLVPLAAIGTIVMAARREWHRRFATVVTVLAGVGAIGVVLASRSGEALEERFEASGQTIGGTSSATPRWGRALPSSSRSSSSCCSRGPCSLPGVVGWARSGLSP